MTPWRGAQASGINRGLRCGLALLGLALADRCPAADSRFDLEWPLVLTQVPRQMKAPRAGWDSKGLVRSDWFSGARLVVVAPGGKVQVLSQGFQSACDPNLSFDGQRVLFSGKQEARSRWRIWEIGLNGQGLRPVSPEGLEARSPIHVSTLFTLDSPEPWFTTVFVRGEGSVNEAGRPSASSLYNLKLDGTELRRLTFNPNHNLDPFQMWDGRVLYAAERYPNVPGGPGGHVGLYAIHVEGADAERYGGELGARIQHMPCATERGLIVFVEAEQATWDGAGQLACVEERRPHVTYRQLTEDRTHRFLHPSPWQGNSLLVSRRSADGRGTCGVFRFDAESRQCELVFDNPDYHDVQAVAAKPRPRPDGHSTVVNPKFDTGTFYGLNCYDADARIASHLPTGAVARVRFIEGMPQPAFPARRASSTDLPVPRRLVGEAPVEADGSFNVEVPADTPLLLQTLDARGLALSTCGWIWVKPKETRGCIGCHEDPERIPENEYVLALRRPSNRLTLPPEQRRVLSFRQDVAPILKDHCATAACHGGKRTPLHLPLTVETPGELDLQKAYSALLAPARGPSKDPSRAPRQGKYVDAGRARTSWLVWQLMGTDTSRPWDKDEMPTVTTREVQQMPPPGKGRPLRAEDLRTLVQWIDLGAPYQAVTATAPITNKPVQTK